MDAVKLRELMKVKGITVSAMCAAIGISRKAFWAKCNGKSEFKQSEIVKIMNVLELEDGTFIFFKQSVS